MNSIDSLFQRLKTNNLKQANFTVNVFTVDYSFLFRECGFVDKVKLYS